MSCVKITDLQFANPLVGNEIVPVVQQGTSYQVTVSSIGFNADINGENNTIRSFKLTSFCKSVSFTPYNCIMITGKCIV